MTIEISSRHIFPSAGLTSICCSASFEQLDALGIDPLDWPFLADGGTLASLGLPVESGLIALRDWRAAGASWGKRALVLDISGYPDISETWRIVDSELLNDVECQRAVIIGIVVAVHPVH